jgi:hypothetical protein
MKLINVVAAFLETRAEPVDAAGEPPCVIQIRLVLFLLKACS